MGAGTEASPFEGSQLSGTEVSYSTTEDLITALSNYTNRHYKLSKDFQETGFYRARWYTGDKAEKSISLGMETLRLCFEIYNAYSAISNRKGITRINN